MGVVLAIVAFGAVFLLSSATGGAGIGGPNTSVVIAKQAITKGSVITSDMLARDISLVPAGAAPAYLPLAKGYVAITIPTAEQQGVAGHISVGDYITVISSANLTLFNSSGAQQGPVRQVSKTVFVNLRVIGLGPASAGVQPANGSGGTTSAAASSGVT
ncbi:MAG: hypothetical protein E6J08_04780, partial [Chloroflexi bacterium]